MFFISLLCHSLDSSLLAHTLADLVVFCRTQNLFPEGYKFLVVLTIRVVVVVNCSLQSFLQSSELPWFEVSVIGSPFSLPCCEIMEIESEC